MDVNGATHGWQKQKNQGPFPGKVTSLTPHYTPFHHLFEKQQIARWWLLTAVAGGSSVATVGAITVEGAP